MIGLPRIVLFVRYDLIGITNGYKLDLLYTLEAVGRVTIIGHILALFCGKIR